MADQLHTLRRIHQPGQHMRPARRIAVVRLILQQDLTVRIINFHIGAAVFHRPDLFAAKPVMITTACRISAPCAVQLLQKQHPCQRPTVILRQKSVIQNVLIQISQIPADLSAVELLQKKAFHRSPVRQIELRELFPVLLHVGIQIGETFLIQIALIGKIQSARCAGSVFPAPDPGKTENTRTAASRADPVPRPPDTIPATQARFCFP